MTTTNRPTSPLHPYAGRYDVHATMPEEGVSREEILRELREMSTEEDRKGEVFHLILSGTADVSSHGTPVAKAGPGEYFGELSLLDGKPRSAQVEAETDLTTFSLASWHFERLMDEQEGLRHQMIVALCDKIRSLTEALSM